MKTCPRCGQEKPYEEFCKGTNIGGTSSYCKPCTKAYRRQKKLEDPDKVREQGRKSTRSYYQRNREKALASAKRWHEENPEKAKAARDRWLEQHPDFVRNVTAKYRERNRVAAFEAYGGFRCACCGEAEPLFLTIDHIANDGNVHRREMKNTGGSEFFAWLRRNNYPPGFQVLCRNCNWGKHANGGVCPHQSTEGSSTIPEGSRAKRPEARSRQHQADEIVSSPSRGGADSGTQPEPGAQVARRAEHKGTKSTICEQALLPLEAGSISRRRQ